MNQHDLVSAMPALQPLMDAMQDGAAIISQDGTIVCVNRTWRRFNGENDGGQTCDHVGANYLRTCRESAGEGAELRRRIGEGVSGVLGDREEFQAEYPCHSATERRWLEVVVRPLALDGARCALITHRNVTSRMLAPVEANHAEQNAQNLAAIVATMPDAAIAFDLEGRVTSWNAAAAKLYGYERSEALGQSMEIIYPPDWPTRVKDYIAEIVVSELRYFDAVRQTRSGELRTIAITTAPVRSGAGEINGVSSVHRDVTKERVAEQRLRSVLNNLFAFVGVLEPDGTLVEANRAPLDAAGLEAKDVIGKKFWDCYWWNYSPSLQMQLKDACERARGGETVRYDVEVQVAGGHLIWLDFQLAPLRDADGEIVNLIPSGIDISERMTMVEALKASHHTFQNLVAHSPFGIYTVDADFRLAHVSDGAQPIFASVRPLIGHDFADALRIIWPEPFATAAIELFRNTLATGDTYRAPPPTVTRRQDSDEVESYDWMIERIAMPDGRPGVVCNFYDLSERQRYDQHIRLLMREVNHRAKNLLTVVISMARQTARASSPADFVDRFSQRLYSLSASQDLIVKGNWDGVSVNDLVRSQLDHLGEEIRNNRFRIEGHEMIVSPAAAQGIGMALHELSTNALKYGSLSGPAGSISIDWGLEDDGQTFRMRWSERDGPSVTPPERTGFGRTVIERMAATSVGGRVDLQYAASGVTWVLFAPIEGVEITSGAQLLQP